MDRMPTLRLTQTAAGEDLHRLELSLEGDGLARQTAAVRFRRTRRRRSRRGRAGAEVERTRD